MEETVVKEEPAEKESWWNEKVDASLVVTIIFILADRPLFEYFSPWVNRYVFFFLWFSVFGMIYYFLNKQEDINFKDLLKPVGISILIMLIWYNVNNLMISAAEIIPEGVSAWFLPILMVGGLVYLIGFGIHFIEKRSKS